MSAAVPELTLSQERAGLREIRQRAYSITPCTKLTNGMCAGEFALRYVQCSRDRRRLAKRLKRARAQHKRNLAHHTSDGQHDNNV